MPSLLANRFHPGRRAYLPAVAFAAGFVLLALLPSWSAAPGRFLSVYFALFAAYGFFLWRWSGVSGAGWRRLILAVAVVIRVAVLLLHPPDLSQDVARYAWDGHLAVSGINPFAYSPDDPEVAAHRMPFFDDITYREIPTIYPPVAQALFALAALIAPGTFVVRLLLVLCDLLVIWLLGMLLRRASLPDGRLLVYAWCPLPVVEVASSGHVEPLAMLFVLLIPLALDRGRRGLAGALWAGAVMAKIGPILLAPVLARRGGWRALAGGAAAMMLMVAPFLSGGALVFPALGAYTTLWRYNDFFFGGLVGIFKVLDPSAALGYLAGWSRTWIGDGLGDYALGFASPEGAARLVAGALVMATVAFVAARSRAAAAARLDILDAAATIFAVGILVSPTLHPWYLLWLLPLLCFRPSPAWILLCGTVSLSYLDLLAGRDALLGPSPVVWVEMLLPLGLAVYGWSRRGGGLFPGAPVPSRPEARDIRPVAE